MEGPGIEPGASGSVARNSDHYTTEAVLLQSITFIKVVFIEYETKFHIL
jgi:hypothetical protein